MSLGTPTVHKDLSLVSLVPKWSGAETAFPLDEFFASIDGAAQIRREQSDCVRIAVLKLTDAARSFYNGCPELHTEDVTWHRFKSVFNQRFKDVHSDQYHFMKLQTARQGKNESPQEFTNRIRGLSQKVMCKVDDLVAQCIHCESAECILLASFVAGLIGIAGKQVRYTNLQN